jgi:hypothetical protein
MSPPLRLIHGSKGLHESLIKTALRNLNDRPEESQSAARLLLRNALRIAVSHLGRKAAAQVVLQALGEGEQ